MTETDIVTGVSQEQSETATMVRQIAHELRQPLSTIESIAYYLDLILPREDERARGQLERLQELVDQSNWIVSNAVHYVQASPPIPQRILIEDLVASAAEECQIESEVELDVEPGTRVQLDPGQALHLFRNLFTFFCKIVTKRQPLRITVEQGCTSTRVRLTTTASRYSEFEVRSMFEPFGPGLPSGAGLSLASVRRIAEAHEGDIEIDVSPTMGSTTITIVLPS